MTKRSAEAYAIVEGRHSNPFHCLGLHTEGDKSVVRAFLPEASKVDAIDEHGEAAALARIHDDCSPARFRRPGRDQAVLATVGRDAHHHATHHLATISATTATRFKAVRKDSWQKVPKERWSCRLRLCGVRKIRDSNQAHTSPLATKRTNRLRQTYRWF